MMVWHEALRAVLNEYRNEAVVFGEHDCCQFVATYVEAVSGVDYSERFDYVDQAGADALIAEHGGIKGLIGSCLGMSHMPPSEGDVVVADAGPFHTAGIFNGEYVWGLHPEQGLIRIKSRAVIAAWSV